MVVAVTMVLFNHVSDIWSNGYILECEDDDANKESADLLVAHCQKLRDIAGMIQHSNNTVIPDDGPRMNDAQNLFTIEYKDGCCRMYGANNRNTVIITILDFTPM